MILFLNILFALIMFYATYRVYKVKQIVKSTLPTYSIEYVLLLSTLKIIPYLLLTLVIIHAILQTYLRI